MALVLLRIKKPQTAIVTMKWLTTEQSTASAYLVGNLISYLHFTSIPASNTCWQHFYYVNKNVDPLPEKQLHHQEKKIISCLELCATKYDLGEQTSISLCTIISDKMVI